MAAPQPGPTGYKPAAYCPECGTYSTPERGPRSPQSIRHPPTCPERPDAPGWVAALAAEPEQRVLIYGDVVVSVLGVTRASDWNDQWVRLAYRRHFGAGTHLDGWIELPGDRRLLLATD